MLIKRIKLLLILPITTVFLSGCFVSNAPTFNVWKNHEELYQISQKLKIGDIIITNKDWRRPLSWFGHSAIMVSKYKVGEYPQFCTGYYETDAIFWLSKKEKFIVLRYKALSEKFKTALLKSLLNTKNKQYKIVEKKDNSAFYCSQYIWYLFWKTAKDLGYDLDIDKNGGYFVTPYDLLNSKYFNQVLFTP